MHGKHHMIKWFLRREIMQNHVQSSVLPTDSIKTDLCTYPSSHVHTPFNVVCTWQMDGWSTIHFMEMPEASQKQAHQKTWTDKVLTRCILVPEIVIAESSTRVLT